MRRDLLGLRAFVIVAAAYGAGHIAWATGGPTTGITLGATVAVALHTLVGK
jgi:hypothetical protein